MPTPIVADPNVFFSYFLAGLASAGVPKGTNCESWASHAKDAWHQHRKLVDWVSSGQDAKDYAAREAKIKADADALTLLEMQDAENARLVYEKAVKAHGEKAPVMAAK